MNVYFAIGLVVMVTLWIIKAYSAFRGYLGAIFSISSFFFSEFVFLSFLWLIDMIGLFLVLTGWQFDLLGDNWIRQVLLYVYVPIGCLFAFVVGVSNAKSYGLILEDVKDRLKSRKEK